MPDYCPMAPSAWLALLLIAIVLVSVAPTAAMNIRREPPFSQ
jgi:hypothetical protein